MAKLGLKAIPGVNRVTIRKAKHILFVVQDPDVFKSPASDTYIVFGEAKIEDLSGAAAMQSAEQFKQGAPAMGEEDDDEVPELVEDASAAAAPTSAVEVSADDEAGVDAKDIALVMEQAQVGRPEAIKALKKNNNDIVNAIMVNMTGPSPCTYAY